MNKQKQNYDEKGLFHCVNALIQLHSLLKFGQPFWGLAPLHFRNANRKSNMSTRQLK